MYSMVMMMAMSASPEAAALGHGCNGCSGYSCSGYTSCSGGGKHHGCSGGGLFGGGGKHGGGCSGYTTCMGCTGYTTCMGCTGYSCCGGGGKHHGCSGGGFFGGKHHGCCGGGGGLFGGKHHGSSCCGGGCTGFYSNGCNGYSGCMGAPVYGAPVDGTPVPNPAPKKEEKKGGVTAAPAYITVNVPADASISIDGAPTKATSSVRVFATPDLAAGTVYYYTFTATVERDGQKLVATEKIAVEAGVNTQVSLSPAAGATVATK
jgi:uncharacterized protein (TIGR03000 family)